MGQVVIVNIPRPNAIFIARGKIKNPSTLIIILPFGFWLIKGAGIDTEIQAGLDLHFD
jgi:hypothetical protein